MLRVRLACVGFSLLVIAGASACTLASTVGTNAAPPLDAGLPEDASSPDGNARPDGDARTEADAMSLPDGSGPASNPGKVSCGAAECGIPESFCCDGTDPRCVQTTGGACESAAVFLRCDEPADCAGAQRCCLGFGLGNGSHCADDCGTAALRLCKTSTDCGGAGSCRDVACTVSGLGTKSYRSCNTTSQCN